MEVPKEELECQAEALEGVYITKTANAAKSKAGLGWTVQKRTHVSKKSKGVDREEPIPVNEINLPALGSPQRKMGGGKKRVQNHSPYPCPSGSSILSR